MVNIHRKSKVVMMQSLYRHWWHRRLSSRQPPVSPLTTQLASWRLSVFTFSFQNSYCHPMALWHTYRDIITLYLYWCRLIWSPQGGMLRPAFFIHSFVTNSEWLQLRTWYKHGSRWSGYFNLWFVTRHFNRLLAPRWFHPIPHISYPQWGAVHGFATEWTSKAKPLAPLVCIC